MWKIFIVSFSQKFVHACIMIWFLLSIEFQFWSKEKTIIYIAARKLLSWDYNVDSKGAITADMENIAIRHYARFRHNTFFLLYLVMKYKKHLLPYMLNHGFTTYSYGDKWYVKLIIRNNARKLDEEIRKWAMHVLSNSLRIKPTYKRKKININKFMSQISH